MYPSYLNLSEKELNERIRRIFKFLNPCKLCPRKCRVNRLKGERGFCKLGAKAMVSSFNPHFGEERCLVGWGGSGTIFFTYCNLSCVYCQNWEISQMGEGEEIDDEGLAKMMITLQKLGCHNINLVTPTPQVPQILAALKIAIKNGLKIPIVYNSSGYDSVETLKLLDGIVDIYMPDFKYSDNQAALKYSLAVNYFEVAKQAIKEMHRQVGDLLIKSEFEDKKSKWVKNQNFENIFAGVAIRGLLVRHLVLPNNLAGAEKIFEFLAKEISKDTFVNIMDQYRPCWKAYQYPELSRNILLEEYQETIALAKKYGLYRFA